MASENHLHDRRHRGWFWIENNVLDLHGPALGATGIAVYTLLARHVGTDGKAFPSLHRFQVLLGLSRNTVKKYLKLLASPEVGLVRIIERTTLNGDSDSHIYELLTVNGRSTTDLPGSTTDLPGSTIDLPGSTTDLPGSTTDLRVGQPLTYGRSTIDPEGNYLKETQLKEKDLPSENSLEFSTGIPRAQPPKKARANTAETSTTSLVWNAYATEYHDRYGTPPTRNAKVNAQLKQFAQRVPQEAAPHIAAFYVWHTSAYYQTKGHPIGLLLADAEKLHTEWKTNRPILAAQARQQEKTASNPFLPILERLQQEAKDDQR